MSIVWFAQAKRKVGECDHHLSCMHAEHFTRFAGAWKTAYRTGGQNDVKYSVRSISAAGGQAKGLRTFDVESET